MERLSFFILFSVHRVSEHQKKVYFKKLNPFKDVDDTEFLITKKLLPKVQW